MTAKWDEVQNVLLYCNIVLEEETQLYKCVTNIKEEKCFVR